MICGAITIAEVFQHAQLMLFSSLNWSSKWKLETKSKFAHNKKEFTIAFELMHENLDVIFICG